MIGYLTELVAAKRAQPAADLLSALVQARDDDRLTERESVATAFLLLVAGHETTVNLIGNRATTARSTWPRCGTRPSRW